MRLLSILCTLRAFCIGIAVATFVFGLLKWFVWHSPMAAFVDMIVAVAALAIVASVTFLLAERAAESLTAALEAAVAALAAGDEVQ